MQNIKDKSAQASGFLKSLAHPYRLQILCLLAQGERSVTELIAEIQTPQTTLSNHLAKLRHEGIVDYRRDHRTLYYYIKDPHVMRVIGILHDIYCK